MRYKIEILRSAQKQLSKKQHQQQNQIIENIRDAYRMVMEEVEIPPHPESSTMEIEVSV